MRQAVALASKGYRRAAVWTVGVMAAWSLFGGASELADVEQALAAAEDAWLDLEERAP